MTPRKLNVYFGIPSYGGNGGLSSEHPNVRHWFTETILHCKSDPRIGEIVEETVADTPICMVRNKFIVNARKANCDVLVMIDSDQSPNLHKNDLGFQPFFPSSFDFLYKHYDKGPVAICAPYCGPPPHENVYVFRWDNDLWAGDETPFRLAPFSRYEASTMRGISEIAAAPTGLIMYDMRCFELTEPSKLSKSEVMDRFADGTFSKERAMRELSEGWFYYEWENGYASEKASTEDVTQTRDLSLAGMAKLGYNPLYCNWNSPIGHWKPWCVPGRPRMFGVEHIGPAFKRAIADDRTMTTVEEFKTDLDLSHLPVNRIKMNGHVKPTPHKTPVEHLEGLTELARHMKETLGRTPKAVEIGSWHGDSALALVKGGATVMCVDTWEGSKTDQTAALAKESDPYWKFMQNTVHEREAGLIEVAQGESTVVANIFGEEYASHPPLRPNSSPPFDIIFIDADHSYPATKADIEAWIKHLAPDGAMIGHDYRVIQFPGVAQAVEEIFGDRANEYCWDISHGGFWIVWAKDIPDLLPAETADVP